MCGIVMGYVVKVDDRGRVLPSEVRRRLSFVGVCRH